MLYFKMTKAIKKTIFAFVLVLLSSVQTHADTTVVQPTGDRDGSAWTIYPSGNAWDAINDTTTNDDVNYIYTTSTGTSAIQGWSHTDFTTSNGIDSVRLTMRARSPATSGTRKAIFGRKYDAGGGSWSWCTNSGGTDTVDLTSSYANFTTVWTKDPYDNSSWNTTELNNTSRAWAFENNSVGTSPDSFGLNSGNSNWNVAVNGVDCQAFTMGTQAGTLTNLRIYISDVSVGGTVRLAIYSDASGYPNTKLWGDNTGVSQANGWVSVTTSGVSLSASTSYWLCFSDTVAACSTSYQTGGASNSHRWRTWPSSGGWPASYTTSGWSGANTNQYAMKGIYNVTQANRITQSFLVIYYYDASPPDTVTGVDTTAVTTTTVSLVCDKNDSADCGGYMVRYAAGATAPATYDAGTFGDSTSHIDSTSFSISGLSENTQYSFTIFARDGVPNWTVKGSDSWVTVTTANWDNYYVRKSGSNSNNGASSSSAWLTIPYAVSQIASGDTLWIGAGDYSAESLTVTDKDYADWTCFFGDYDGSRTGDSGEVSIHSVCANTDWGKVHLDHLHAVHWNACGDAYDAGIGFFNDADGRVKVTHCIIDSATANYGTRYFEFTNNFVKSSGGKGFYSAVRFAEIDTCYIYNNTMGDYHDWSGGPVLYLDGTSSSRHYWVRNNLFYHVQGADDWYIGLQHYSTLTWEVIDYNFFDTSYTNRFCATREDNGWTYYATPSAWQSATPFDDHSYEGNPGLDTDNYHLLNSSPCIDVGTSNVSTLVTDDIDGESRPLNNGYDVGCDENPFVVSLSISVSPTTWDLDTLNPSQIKTMTSGERIFVKNEGNVIEQLSLKIDTVDTKGEWSCSESEDGQSQNIYVMSGVFWDPEKTDIAEEHFNQAESDDVIDTVIQWADAPSEIFSVEKNAFGDNVAVDDSVGLWLQLKMPTTAAGPKADSSRNIIIQIGCQQTP